MEPNDKGVVQVIKTEVRGSLLASAVYRQSTQLLELIRRVDALPSCCRVWMQTKILAAKG
jgi:hypothetical protein